MASASAGIETIKVGTESLLLAREIPISDITPSQTNRYIPSASIDELAKSIDKDGLLQPITVRPNPIKGGAKFEIVLGEARWKAKRKLNHKTIAAVVAPYDDVQAQAVQIVENLHRTDPTPLDEASAYGNMRKLLGKSASIGELAMRVAKTEAYVAQRLKLLDLATEVQNALKQEHIALGHALLLAPLTREQQLTTLKWLLKGFEERIDERDWENRVKQAHSVTATKRFIEDNFMLALEKAPFDINAKDLGPNGPCPSCQFNTANAGNLFPDIKGARCTQPSCFALKRRHTIDIMVADVAKKEGIAKPYRLGLGWARENEGPMKIAVDGFLARDSYSDGPRLVAKGNECKSTRAAVLVYRSDRVETQIKAKVGDVTAICTNEKCDKHHQQNSGSGTASKAPLKGMAFVSHKEGNLKKSRGERIRWAVFKALCETILKGDEPATKPFGERLQIVAGLAASHLYHDNARDAVKALGLVQRQKKGGYGQVDWDEKLREYFPKDKPWAYLMAIMAADDIRQEPSKGDEKESIDLYSKRYNGGPHKLFWLARHYKIDVASITKAIEAGDKAAVDKMTANVKAREAKGKTKVKAKVVKTAS